MRKTKFGYQTAVKRYQMALTKRMFTR